MSHLITMVSPDGEHTYVSAAAVEPLTARGYSVLGDTTPKKRGRKPDSAPPADPADE